MTRTWYGSRAALGRLAVLASLAGGALLLSGCNDKNKFAAPPPSKVTVAAPTQAPVTLYAEFTGKTAASLAVDLEARVQGYLTAIGYRDGDAVKKGAELFEIEKDQYRDQVALQKAQLAIAQAKEANAKVQYERQLAMGQKEAASQRSVDDMRTAFDEAKGQVAADQANLDLADLTYSYASVRAPFDGVVTRHLVDVGSLVGSSGPTKLATILQVDPLYVYFNMTEQQQIDMREALAAQGKTLRDVRESRVEPPVEVALGRDETFKYAGKIDYIAPQLDGATGSLQMRASLPNKTVELIPGQFVRVRVPTGKIEKALLVNDTAVRSNQAGSYVMVVGKDNVVEQRYVTTGPVRGQLRVITKGLNADDQVVIGSIQRAIAGKKVAPVNGAMAAVPEDPAPATGSPNLNAKSSTP
ncbi:membrane fusion protein, multidrug efflux system [Enhydrobacter aerosaccus]|uniref:Membrane fusion protein, multidrug efflux system n=1 Tax=Enhydrobacter aerosaccus TaxID=225324 RepID=A0A1T4TEG1_9HYPH|nr:efflux RND transporter periplasmic adaptor subunit [Enhydrobacter aerosaccus]SKA38870.1 membrane fusion protein, multidrug efflux system [Enhydrobacter aerosaccus]